MRKDQTQRHLWARPCQFGCLWFETDWVCQWIAAHKGHRCHKSIHTKPPPLTCTCACTWNLCVCFMTIHLCDTPQLKFGASCSSMTVNCLSCLQLCGVNGVHLLRLNHDSNPSRFRMAGIISTEESRAERVHQSAASCLTADAAE